MDGVSFHIKAGESFGLVGESGCGKTTLGKAVAGILKPERGEILFDGQPVLPGKFRPDLQMVFQDPYGSLNPRMKIRQQLLEGLRNYRIGSREEQKVRLAEVVEAVQLPSQCLDLLPRALSGGQKQRAVLARSILPKPKLLILDEPTSALDSVARSAIIKLLCRLTESYRLSTLVISHDLAALDKLCNRVAVMYLGKLVETGAGDRLFSVPRHYYTRLLLDSYLPPYPHTRKITATGNGARESFSATPPGCRFHPRCPAAALICRTAVPPLREVASGHFCACHRA